MKYHDDVIKWKHFPRYWPFVRGIHRSRWIPRTKASDADFDVFLDLRLNKRLSKQPRCWWFETPSWSLWSHRNVFSGTGVKLNAVCKIHKYSTQRDVILDELCFSFLRCIVVSTRNQLSLTSSNGWVRYYCLCRASLSCYFQKILNICYIWYIYNTTTNTSQWCFNKTWNICSSFLKWLESVCHVHILNLLMSKHIDSLMQDRSISCGLTIEILQSRIKPSKWCLNMKPHF